MAMNTSRTLVSEQVAGQWYAGLTPRHWRILWGAYLGWIFDGYEAVALVYALGPALKTILTPEQAQTPAFYIGASIGITLLGWGIGGLLGGVAADYIGRKRMMMLSILGYALFTGLTAFAGSFFQLALLRFITGLAIGSEWSTGVALVAETWPNKARPKGCGFLQSGFGGGAVLAALVWLVLSATNPLGAESWRIMFALGALPAFVCLYLRRALEESERWMMAVKEQRWAATEEDAEGGAVPKEGRASVHADRDLPRAGKPASRAARDSDVVRDHGWLVGGFVLAAGLYGGSGQGGRRAGQCLGPSHGHHLQHRRDLRLSRIGLRRRRDRAPEVPVLDLSGMPRHFGPRLYVVGQP